MSALRKSDMYAIIGSVLVVVTLSYFVLSGAKKSINQDLQDVQRTLENEFKINRGYNKSIVIGGGSRIKTSNLKSYFNLNHPNMYMLLFVGILIGYILSFFP
jgi:hypothetical protein